MPRPTKIAAIALITGALSVGGWVTYERTKTRNLSDTIIGRWDRLGGEPWLLPSLNRARVFQPDRPHSFKEVHAWRMGEGKDITRVREYALSTNSERLRGPELRPKAAGAKRVIAIGDSVTHGWGVSFEEAYPAQLERKLRAAGHTVEVINAGVPANPVSVMERWCTTVGPTLDPDIIIWTRRSAQQGPQPVPAYARAVQRCKAATGAEMIVALPPVSTFDVKGSRLWETERNHLAAAIGSGARVVMDLTPYFRRAQAGRGEILEERGGKLAVVDQESGRVWLTAPPSPHDLPAEIYDLFEREPEVREAMFFDEGHPDAEGFGVFADALVSPVADLLAAPKSR